MNWLLGILIAGITSFIATNLDDILVLMVFFSQPKRQFSNWQIICGQYLGFTIILLLSLPGLLGGLFIPKEWIGLLGFIPIFMGIKQWQNFNQDNAGIPDVTLSLPAANPPHFSYILKAILSSKICQVAAIAIANGGDNISIYLSLFAGGSLSDFGVFVVIFYIMLGFWCFIAYQLTRRPLIAKVLTRHGHHLTPFILASLGIYIILESKVYELFLISS
jgi:cadmium resistance transport/sequestration family protein